MAITAASAAALQLLRGAGGPVAVHSRFRSGVNLASGGILAFTGPQAASGACGLEVTPADVARLAGGDAWLWRGDALCSPRDGTAAVRLAPGARVYPARPPRLRQVAADSAERLRRLRERLGGRSWFDDGIGYRWGLPRLHAALAALVTLAAAGAPVPGAGASAAAGPGAATGSGAATGPGAATGIARRPAEAPARGVEPEPADTDAVSPDAEAARAVLCGVVGLGIGLTPSGDDALVGGWCLVAGLGMAPRHAAELAEGLLTDTQGRARTTDVAASYLRLASRGVFSPSLSAVVGLLGEPEDAGPGATGRSGTGGPGAGRLAAAVTAELRYGATSGADALVGVQEAARILQTRHAPGLRA